MISRTYNITGMSSGSCSEKLEHKLNCLPFVNADVSLCGGYAKISSIRPIDDALIIRTVEQAGYGVNII